MAIQRWEMLLSAQKDCYLLKIQGDREDVDRIVSAHLHSCQSVQEISGDLFQWVIFIVDAPLSERLSIQNQVMSLTSDTSGTKPSDELINILDGLSGALQDLTNLTDDEQAFVMNKMARMGSAVPPAAPPPPTAPPTPLKAPARIAPPTGAPQPMGTPLPRVTFPGQPGTPTAPKGPTAPAGQPSLKPLFPGAPAPLPAMGPVTNIIRPVQPPRPSQGTPLPPQTALPKKPEPPTPPPPVVAKPNPPSTAPPVVPEEHKKEPDLIEDMTRLIPALETLKEAILPPGEKPASPTSSAETPAPVTATPPPSPEPKTPPPPPIPALSELKIEPLAYTPPRTEEPPQPPATLSKETPKGLEKEEKPVPSSPAKGEDNANLRICVFYPTGQESNMNQFLNTLTEVAQKKSKRPTAFEVAFSVPTEVSIENSTEWIWKAKTSGSDIFFVIVPSGLGSELLDPLIGEAQSAGLRCFLVPEGEIKSRLLYMDLMVELIMFKRRVRPSP